MPIDDRSPEAMTLFSLRTARDWSQKHLAAALGVEHTRISWAETSSNLDPDALGFYVAPLGFAPAAVETLLGAFRRVLTPAPNTSPEPLTGPMAYAAAAAGTVVETQLLAELPREKARAAMRTAEGLFHLLAGRPASEHRGIVEACPSFQTWAVAVQFCSASLRAAVHTPAEARRLAELGLLVAEKAPGRSRLRLRAWCWGHLANARRVATDFDGADAAFVRTWQLWREGGPASLSEWLPEWRLLSLEASLRREQRRLPEALNLLDRALECGGEPAAQARFLLQKEHVYEVMGDLPSALAALAQAAPLVEGSGDPHLLFALRFNEADLCCSLRRFEDAAERLPTVAQLALDQGAVLDNLRVGWLTARVAAGLGGIADAVSRLEQLRSDFTALDLPYEAALSSLDLAALWLEEARIFEVRKLALEMAWIFKAQGIHREALAALKLFRDAALCEAATTESARRTIAEIETVRRSSPPVRGGGREALAL